MLKFWRIDNRNFVSIMSEIRNKRVNKNTTSTPQGDEHYRYSGEEN